MAMKVVCTGYSGRDPPLEVGVGNEVEVELGSSESAEATWPRIVEASAQTSPKLLTTVGSDASSPYTHVWFVWPKLRSPSVTSARILSMYPDTDQSTHWGKAERNVSVQAHWRTSMKAPGLKII